MSDQDFGKAVSASDAGLFGDVALPEAAVDSGVMGLYDDAAVFDAASGACPASTTPGLGHVCITVDIAGAGPSAASDADALSLAGVGVLVVGLSSEPPTADTTFKAWTSLPSAASGATLHVSDLPRSVDFDVAPGTYFLAAAFRQTPPFDRKISAVGDFVQATLTASSLPVITAVADAGVAAPSVIGLSAVRAVDATISIDGSLQYPGSGAGPLVVRLNEAASTTVADIESAECVDLVGMGPKTIRMLTTSTETDFDLRAALFDYAADLSDPRVQPWLDPTAPVYDAPDGTICEGVSEKPFRLHIPADRWLADPVDVALDDVWGSVGSSTTDPSTACHAIALP